MLKVRAWTSLLPAALGMFSLSLSAGCASAPISSPSEPRAVPATAAAEPAPVLDSVSLEAFAALLRLEDTRVFDPARLEGFARSSSAPLRARTALALGRLGRPDALPTLRTLLADSDSAVAATAAFALGEIADSAAVPLLAEILLGTVERGRLTVAAEAAYALGKLGSAAAHSTITSYLQRGDPSTASPEPVGSALLAVWRFPRPTDLTPITRWLDASDPEIRWRATYAVVRRASPALARRLVTLGEDHDPRVRALAVRALSAAQLDSAGIPAADVLPLLFRAIRDPDYTVRISAVRTLGTHRAPVVVDSLRSLLAARDRHLVITAMESLGRLGAAAASGAAELAAIARADTAHLFVRQTALESLAPVAPEVARSVARELRMHPSWRMRAASARALARGEAGATPELRALLTDADSRVATATLQAIVDAAGDSVARVRPLLLEQLTNRDPFVRTIALDALARVRDPATFPALLDAYDAARRDSVNDATLAALGAIAALRDSQLDPARAFFARFPRPDDFLVRRRASELFGAAATAAWGEPLPAETRASSEVYRTLVAQWGGGWTASARVPGVEIETDAGAIRLRFYGDAAPLTTENFLALARRGYFDGQEWPRVVANFVVQGGDPRGDTNGGPGYAIRDEINRYRYQTGSVGMALSGPDTGGSQFFITHSPQPHLDGIYTLFGELVEGAELLQAILPGDLIRSVRVLP